MSTKTTHIAKPSNPDLFGQLMQHAEIDKMAAYGNKTMSWSALQNLPLTIKRACLANAMALQDKTEILKAYDYLDKETDVVVRTLSRDLEVVGSTVQEIEDKHSSRSGSARNQEEELAIQHIHAEYVALNERYQATVAPNLLIVTERVTDLVSDIKAGKVAEIVPVKEKQ